MGLQVESHGILKVVDSCEVQIVGERTPALEDLTEYLVGLEEPIFKVTIRRTEPEDYAGYLDTIDVHGPDDVSIGTLIELYGGGKYSLRIKDARGRYIGHRTVQICGPPLQRGKPSRSRRMVEADTAPLKKEINQLKVEQKRLAQKVDALVTQIGLLSITCK